MPRGRYVTLTADEDKQLQELEHDSGTNEKVRLRAKVVRLSQRRMSVEEIARYTGRHSVSILRDFNRWEAAGVEGLADGVGSGQRSPIGEMEKAFVVERLSEDRSWTASQLAETVNETFKLKVNRETMRVCLQKLGYSWQRQRYVPVQQPDSKLLAAKQAELDGLKKSPSR